MMGNGVVLTNGSKWKRQRKLAQVIFKKEELQKLTPEILLHVDNMILEWMSKADRHQSLNVQEEIRDLVMKIMAGCLFRLEDKRNTDKIKIKFLGR